MKNKKAVMGAIIMWVLVIVGFIVISTIVLKWFSKTDDASAEILCRGSVAARTKTEFKKGPIELQPTPLLCRTINKKLPKDSNADKEAVMKGFADLMAKCWWMFGEGIIEKPFEDEGGSSWKQNCFLCYTIDAKKSEGLKTEIQPEELAKYMFETPYKVKTVEDSCHQGGGFCVDDENSCKSIENEEYFEYDEGNEICKKQNKKGCCYSNYECLNKGGECKESNFKDENYKKYTKWKCPEENACFIKTENFVSYGEYIQSYSSAGNVMILTPIKQAETYAVSFGAPTEGDCNWCAFGGGVVGGVVALFVPGGFVFGTVTGVFSASALKMLDIKIADALGKRKVNTIYLTTLNQIQEGGHCTLVEDIGGK